MTLGTKESCQRLEEGTDSSRQAGGEGPSGGTHQGAGGTPGASPRVPTRFLCGKTLKATEVFTAFGARVLVPQRAGRAPSYRVQCTPLSGAWVRPPALAPQCPWPPVHAAGRPLHQGTPVPPGPGAGLITPSGTAHRVQWGTRALPRPAHWTPPRPPHLQKGLPRMGVPPPGPEFALSPSLWVTDTRVTPPSSRPSHH